MSDILNKILQRKQEEISERVQHTPLAKIKEMAASADPVRNFHRAISSQVANSESAVIAEIKKASPSKGLIRENFNPEEIAKSYQQHGATCLSVLTDKDFFQGSEEYLKTARNACNLPILRKDFTVDPYQVYEARAIDADAILLIVAALSDEQLKTLYDTATELGMSALVEVHNREELLRALKLPEQALLGINNRNLRTFETALTNTTDLLDILPDERVIVTESGIHSKKDVEFMHQHNINAFLVGEAFMRAKNPGEELAKLFFE